MASAIPGPGQVLEPARKRQKLSPRPSQFSTKVESTIENNPFLEAQVQGMVRSAMASQVTREAEAGILCYVNESNPGFYGILKQRYTDFLVNEVSLDGQVVHLTDINAPRRKPSRKSPERNSPPTGKVEELVTVQAEATPQPVAQQNLPICESCDVSEEVVADAQPPGGFAMSVDDTQLLDSYFGADVRMLIVKLNEKAVQCPKAKPGSLGSVSSDPITDRQLRTQLHKDMRRIFNSRLETVSDVNGVVKISVAKKNKPQGRYEQIDNGIDNGRFKQAKGKLIWQEVGGEYLHFSLYKENKDTMEVISYLSSRLKTTPKQFAFAGTKDRRGVTVQRVSVFRMPVENLARLNKTLYSAKIGNFQYKKHGLDLGDLIGNEFLITLRDCRFVGSDTADDEERVALANTVVGAAVRNMQNHGFINYYGLQRFGSYAVGTDEVGKRILKGDFEGAVNAILTYGDDALACAMNPAFVPADGKPLSRDDIARAHAIHLFKTTGKGQLATEKLPRKFNGETSIIRHLSRHSGDFIGALISIPRNLRLMYVHAYQSLVWNMAASERWTRYGNKVVKGDLVLLGSISGKNIKSVQENEVDENGEIIVLPAADDVAISSDDIFQRAKALSAEEAASGRYNIFDIVLPTSGYDIEYPDNDIGDYYRKFMMSERGGGLDPATMRRPQKDFSLSGSYRKLLAQIGNDMSYEIKLYTDDNEQMVKTDLEKIVGLMAGHENKSQGHRSQEAPWAPGDKASSERNLRQLNAWRSLPSKLAEEDRAEAELFEAQRAAAAELPKVEVSQPAYKETFIQRSAEHGRRTGHREKTVMPGITIDAPEVPVSDNPATNGKNDGDRDADTKEKEGPIAEEPKSGVLSHVASLPPEATSAESGVSVQSNPEAGQEKDQGSSNMASEALVTNAKDEETLATEVKKRKIAVIVKFQLGSSQYATMALRELMKEGVQVYKPEYGSGR